MAVTFDGIARLIRVTDNTVFTLDVERELYSEWKRWSQIGDNSKYAPAFRTFGGDGTAPGQIAPKYFFLQNFWRVFIDNGNVVSIGLNLYTDDYATPYVVANGSGVSDRNSDAVSVNSEDIQYSSFQGGVTIDVVNGTTGTAFPKGTPKNPVNNIPDALTIATNRGFNMIYVKGDLTIAAPYDVSNYEFLGDGTNKTTITVEAGATVTEIEIRHATVQGEFDGKALIEFCNLLNLTSIEAEFYKCTLSGTITLTGTGITIIEECRDGLVLTGSYPVIDFAGTGHNLAIREYHGDVALRNKSGTGSVEVNMNSGGKVILENTVTNGTVRLSGMLQLVDDSTGSTIVNSEEVVYPNLQQLSAFNNRVHIDVVRGVAGTKFPLGTQQFPVNNLADAIQIANKRDLIEFEVSGTLVISNTNVSGYKFHGENPLSSVVVLSGTGNTTERTSFYDMIVTGRVNGSIFAQKCGLQTLSNIGASTFPSIFNECILRADVGATPAIQFKLNAVGDQNIHFVNCISGVPGELAPTFDINGSDAPFALRKYGGGAAFNNFSAGQEATVEVQEGQVKFLSGCTNGTLQLRGGADVTQNDSGPGFLINRGADLIKLLNDILATGGSLTPEQNQKLIDIHKFLSLDPNHEVTHTEDSIVVDDITIGIIGDNNIKIAQREP